MTSRSDKHGPDAEYSDIDLKPEQDQKLSSALADRVRVNMIAFRKRRSLHQDDFAAKCDWGVHTVQRLERGDSLWSLEKIEKVSQTFNVPVTYFMLPFTGFEEDTSLIRVLRSLENLEKP